MLPPNTHGLPSVEGSLVDSAQRDQEICVEKKLDTAMVVGSDCILMHKWLRILIAITATAVLVFCLFVWYISREALPPEVRIAAGQQNGLYHTFSQQFAKRLHERTGCPVRVVETNGSEDNLRLIRDGGAELALIQTTSFAPESVVGIAPLFSEPLYFIARKGKAIQSPADLVGKRLALGLAGSSIRTNAWTVLTHYDVAPESVRDAAEHFGVLATGS